MVAHGDYECIRDYRVHSKYHAGRLGHLNSEVTNTTTLQIALGACLARESRMQAHCLQLRSQQLPHPAFRFRMFFSDFIAIFRFAKAVTNRVDHMII